MRNTILNVVVGTVVLATFGAGLWFRVAALETIPGINGDEAWYGVQAAELLAGRPVALRTPTGLPLNPFFVGIEVILLSACEPAFWILRAPAVLSGVLAVALTYVLGARALDKPTALVAALLLAALPIAVGYSRFGWDASQTPLFSLLALYCALRDERVGLIVALAGCLVVHATNVFLVPILAAPLAVSLYRGLDQAEAKKRLLLTLAIVSVAGVVALAILTQRSDRRHFALLLSPSDGLSYLTFYGRLLSGISLYQFVAGPVREGVVRLHDRVFWVLVPAILALGTAALVRGRRWDRVALIVGVLLGLGCFYVVTGPDAIEPHWERYGMFLVVPSVLAFSCALSAIFSRSAGPGDAGIRVGPLMLALIVCAAFLVNVQIHYFDAIRSGGGSHVAFRTAGVEPKQQAFALIVEDDARRPSDRGSGARRVLAEGWWLYWPLRYLAASREGIEVVRFGEIAPDAERRRRALRGELQAGAYAVGFADEEVDRTIREDIPAGQMVRWDIADSGGRRLLSVYRTRSR